MDTGFSIKQNRNIYIFAIRMEAIYRVSKRGDRRRVGGEVGRVETMEGGLEGHGACARVKGRNRRRPRKKTRCDASSRTS